MVSYPSDLCLDTYAMLQPNVASRKEVSRTTLLYSEKFLVEKVLR